jgi:hypothetical protein
VLTVAKGRLGRWGRQALALVDAADYAAQGAYVWASLGNAMSHINAASYERARRLANLAVFAIALQCRRLNKAEPVDETFVARKWYDFEFLLLALIRLRRIAQHVANLPELTPVLAPALAEFDMALPGLRLMRNVAEHVDDYAFDKGHNPGVTKEMLEVSTLESDGPTLTWLGASLNATRALHAAEMLFQAIQNAGAAYTEG